MGVVDAAGDADLDVVDVQVPRRVDAVDAGERRDVAVADAVGQPEAVVAQAGEAGEHRQRLCEGQLQIVAGVLHLVVDSVVVAARTVLVAGLGVAGVTAVEAVLLDPAAQALVRIADAAGVHGELAHVGVGPQEAPAQLQVREAHTIIQVQVGVEAVAAAVLLHKAEAGADERLPFKAPLAGVRQRQRRPGAAATRGSLVGRRVALHAASASPRGLTPSGRVRERCRNAQCRDDAQQAEQQACLGHQRNR